MKNNNTVKYAVLSLLLTGSLILSAGEALASSVSGTQTGSDGINAQVNENDITHNEVQIDPLTGEPITEEDGSSSTSVALDSNVSYDSGSQMFIYSFGADTADEFSCTVVDGMYTNSTVSAVCGEGLTCRVFLDGAEQKEQNLAAITTPGNYVLLFTGADLSDEISFRFRIIGDYTNAVEYDLPSGFRITNAYLNGGYTEYSENRISFDQEGEYQIYYNCSVTGVDYILGFTVDHTAPVLALAAVDESGYARSAVDLSDLEAGAVIYAELNGDSIDPGNRLTQPGRYVLTVVDGAGNFTVYNFVIRMYFTVSTVVFLLFLLVIFGGLTGYIIISRRNLKVR